MLSLVLSAFFKRAQLNGFVELDKLRRQLCAAKAVALAGKKDLPTPRDDHANVWPLSPRTLAMAAAPPKSHATSTGGRLKFDALGV